MSKNEDTAKERTNWAEDRTILANERTYSSWMGMGLGAVGIAIGLKAVFGATDPTWVAKTVASLFLAIAIMVFWLARHQARKTLTRLHNNDVEVMGSRNFTLIAISLTLATLAVGAVLWSL